MSRRKHAAFTLVELLVVIALILLLASLLLPALSRAMDNARATLCLNNLHQIAAACFVFAGDHHGLLPYGVQMNSWGWRWETMLIPYLGLATFTNGEATTAAEAGRMILGYPGLPQYSWWQPPRVIAKAAVLACPQDDPYRNWSPDYFLLKSYSHNNGWLYDGPFRYGCQYNVSSIMQPQTTLMFMDNYDGFAGMNWGQFMITGPLEWGRGYDVRTAEAVEQIKKDYGIVIPPGFRRESIYAEGVLRVPAGYPYHRGGMNVILCDSSAKLMKLEETFYPINMWTMEVYYKTSTFAF